jgi:hypothetical protein
MATDTAEAAILAALREAEGDGLLARKAIAAAAGEKNPSEPRSTRSGRVRPTSGSSRTSQPALTPAG